MCVNVELIGTPPIGKLSNWPISDPLGLTPLPLLPPTLGVEKSPFRIAAERLYDENVNRARLIRHFETLK